VAPSEGSNHVVEDAAMSLVSHQVEDMALVSHRHEAGEVALVSHHQPAEEEAASVSPPLLGDEFPPDKNADEADLSGTPPPSRPSSTPLRHLAVRLP
jgi:hypothetical protein